MSEPDDHLTGLLKQAADAAQDRTVPAPAAEILARGTRHRRRRFAAMAAAACLAVGVVTGSATIVLTPSDHGGRIEPAGDPTPDVSPTASESLPARRHPSPTPSETVPAEPDPGHTTVFPPGPGGSATTASDPAG